jgi:hypothetical protein
MRLVCSFVLSALLVFPNGLQSAQSKQDTKEQQPAQKPETAPLKQPLAFGLEDGTPIKLRLTRNLSSADATTGDRVDFEVLEDVKVKDVIIVPRGGLALATITEAQHKRRMARGGKLNVNIDDVRLADGEKAPLRAVKETQGGGRSDDRCDYRYRHRVFPCRSALSVHARQGHHDSKGNRDHGLHKRGYPARLETVFGASDYD